MTCFLSTTKSSLLMFSHVDLDKLITLEFAMTTFQLFLQMLHTCRSMICIPVCTYVVHIRYYIHRHIHLFFFSFFLWEEKEKKKKSSWLQFQSWGKSLYLYYVRKDVADIEKNDFYVAAQASQSTSSYFKCLISFFPLILPSADACKVKKNFFYVFSILIDSPLL